MLSPPRPDAERVARTVELLVVKGRPFGNAAKPLHGVEHQIGVVGVLAHDRELRVGEGPRLFQNGVGHHHLAEVVQIARDLQQTRLGLGQAEGPRQRPGGCGNPGGMGGGERRAEIDDLAHQQRPGAHAVQIQLQAAAGVALAQKGEQARRNKVQPEFVPAGNQQKGLHHPAVDGAARHAANFRGKVVVLVQHVDAPVHGPFQGVGQQDDLGQQAHARVRPVRLQFRQRGMVQAHHLRRLGQARPLRQQIRAHGAMLVHVFHAGGAHVQFVFRRQRTHVMQQRRDEQRLLVLLRKVQRLGQFPRHEGDPQLMLRQRRAGKVKRLRNGQQHVRQVDRNPRIHGPPGTVPPTPGNSAPAVVRPAAAPCSPTATDNIDDHRLYRRANDGVNKQMTLYRIPCLPGWGAVVACLLFRRGETTRGDGATVRPGRHSTQLACLHARQRKEAGSNASGL